MLLPNVCNKIGQQLPQLLFILYRLVSFTKPAEESLDSPESPEEPPWPLGHRRESWDAAGTASTTTKSNIRCLGRHFSRCCATDRPIVHLSLRTVTALKAFADCYRFPVNLLQFLKGPVDYLEQRHILMTSRDEEYFKSQVEVITIFQTLLKCRQF